MENLVDPFFGSGAILLGRPRPFRGTETINDLDGFVCNFWRAVQADPDAVARYADWIVSENDLHARHIWLVSRKDSLQARLEGDPDFFDAKVAGWWLWGICAWIGRGWCSGRGPWSVAEVDGVSQLVHLGNAGRGVNRTRVHLSRGYCLHGAHVSEDSCAAMSLHIREMMGALSDRIRRVRVCCGDWSRVCGTVPTVYLGLTAVFLDPPYADTAKRDPDLYRKECLVVAHDVREWALQRGDDPLMRIALCGYDGQHDMPDSWECVPWKARGGFGSQHRDGENANAWRERIWFSPNCIKPDTIDYPLFAGLGDTSP